MKRFLKNSFVPTFPAQPTFEEHLSLGINVRKGRACSTTWLGRKSEASPSEQSLCSDFFRPTHGPAHRLLWATRSNLAGRLGKDYFVFLYLLVDNWEREESESEMKIWAFIQSTTPQARWEMLIFVYLAVDEIRSDRKWKWKENMISLLVQKSTDLLWNAYSAIV